MTTTRLKPVRRRPRWWLLPAAVLAATTVSAQTAPASRWVHGSSVNLRAAPSVNAPVLRRLALNAQVQLREVLAAGGYCKVAMEDAAGQPVEGYTACQYLAVTPLVLENIASRTLPDGKPNPIYDPAKAFWIEPSWIRLVEYAIFLTDTRSTPETSEDAKKPPRPADPELQRMKEHLAKGTYAPPPEPYPAWEGIRSRNESHRLHLGGVSFDQVHDPKGLDRLRELMHSIELPTVRPSAFRRNADVAPPHESTAALSGRFRIIHSYRVQPRHVGPTADWGPGRAWDIGIVTTALTRPVQQVTLLRDGHMRSEPTHASVTGIEYGDLDGPMCPGFVAGFQWGDGDPSIWRTDLVDGTRAQSLKLRPAGSLFRLYTAQPLAGPGALLATQRLRLDPEKTGFARAVHLHYDLDGDGVADFSVWEGTGLGPGHLGAAPTTDDAYHRIAFVNIAGQWRLFAIDSFQYGCGC